MSAAAGPRPGALLPVVLDVDTGVDDALAILLAVRHPRVDLRAVTCVAGNTDVEQVVQNTLSVLDAAGAPGTPVGRGADGPLGPLGAPTSRTPEHGTDAHGASAHGRHAHGMDGMGDLDLAAPARRDADGTAGEVLRRALLKPGPPVTLVALAPLTNLALLLRTCPGVSRRLARVLVMGGPGGGGDLAAGAPAEFNIAADPAAAAQVVGAPGLEVTLYGLDVFSDVLVPQAQARALAALPDPGARLAGRLLQVQAARHGGGAAPLGDAGALAAVLDPAGLTTRRMPVTVGSRGPWTRAVAVAVDGVRCRRVFLDALAPGGA